MFAPGLSQIDGRPFWRTKDDGAGPQVLPPDQSVTLGAAIAVTATLPNPSVTGGAGPDPYAVAETTSTTSTSTTFADAVTIASSSLNAGHEYLVIARCSRRMSVNTISSKHRVEVGGSEVSGSLSIYRPDAANEDMVDYFWHGIVTPTSGQSIAISHALASGSDTLTTKDAVLTVLDLNQLTVNTDYKTAVTTTDQTISQTGDTEGNFTSSIKETLNWTPGTASEDWLIFWTASVLHGGGTGTSHFLRARASYDDETFVPFYPQAPANSTADIHQYGGFFIREGITAAAHKTEIQMTVGSSSHTAKYTRVTALRLNAFAAHVVSQATSGSESSGWQNLLAADHTPSVADDYIILGYTSVDNAGASVTQINNRITLEGTVVPTSWANGTVDVNPGGTSFSDIELHQAALEAFASGSVQDVDLDLNANIAISTIGYQALAVFSMALDVGASTQNITANTLAVTATLPNPTVTPGSVSTTPNAIAVTATLPNPSLSHIIAANTIAVTPSLPDPTVTPGSVSTTPAVIAVTATLPNPTVTPGSVTVTPNQIAVTASLLDPSVTLGPVTITPDQIAVTAVLPNPTVTPGSVTATPDQIAVTPGLPNPTLSHIITANVLAVTATLPSPSVSQTITATTIAVTASLPNPSVSVGSVTVTPDPVAVTAVLPVPDISQTGPGTQTITADVLAVTVGLPSPDIQPGSVTITANTLPVSSSLPNPSIQPGAVTVTPDAIALAVALPSPQISVGSVSTTPAVIAISPTLPAPSVAPGSVTLTPDQITVSPTLPAPASVWLYRQDITATPISNPATLPDPDVTTGEATATPGAITISPALPNPTVTPGAVTLTPDAITITPALPDPTLRQAIAAQTIASTPVLPNPTITTTITVTPGIVAVTVTLPTPSVQLPAYQTSPGTISVTVELPEPYVSGQNGIFVPLLVVAALLRNPSISVSPLKPGNIVLTDRNRYGAGIADQLLHGAGITDQERNSGTMTDQAAGTTLEDTAANLIIDDL